MGNIFSGPHEQQNNQKNMAVNTNISQNQKKNDVDLMTSINIDNEEIDTELPQNEKDNKYTVPMIEVPSEIPSEQQINKNNDKNKNNEEGNNNNENKNNEEGNNNDENNQEGNNDDKNKNDNSTSSENNDNDQLGGKQRYKKYDLSRLIENLENKIQDGGNVEDSYTFSDNENMEQLKKVILKELDELKKNKVGGSNCDCNNQKGGELYEVDDSTSSSSSSTTLNSDSTSSSSSSSSDFFAKKRGKKEFHQENKSDNKKADKRQNKKPERKEKIEESDSSKFHFEPSDTTEVSEKLENIETSNSEEGLSIFPFNSSDIKSSISAKNYKMLRRRV